MITGDKSDFIRWFLHKFWCQNHVLHWCLKHRRLKFLQAHSEYLLLTYLFLYGSMPIIEKFCHFKNSLFICVGAHYHKTIKDQSYFLTFFSPFFYFFSNRHLQTTWKCMPLLTRRILYFLTKGYIAFWNSQQNMTWLCFWQYMIR